jgi:deoxyinosine 3'endonuclease (endonuclease V)
MTGRESYVSDLCDKLGQQYQVIQQSSDYIISRWFDDGHAVEIEFEPDCAHKFACTIYVYQQAEAVEEYGGEILEEEGYIPDIFSLEDLKKHLEVLEEDYSQHSSASS